MTVQQRVVLGTSLRLQEHFNTKLGERNPTALSERKHASSVSQRNVTHVLMAAGLNLRALAPGTLQEMI